MLGEYTTGSLCLQLSEIGADLKNIPATIDMATCMQHCLDMILEQIISEIKNNHKKMNVKHQAGISFL